MPNRQRRLFPVKVAEASRYTCPECMGNLSIPCNHCGGVGYVVCGPSLHKLESPFEWPGFGGTYATCSLCRDTVLQIANDAIGDAGNVNEAA